MAVEIIFVHGWGFSASIWNQWTKRLAGEYPISCYDRGYLGEPQIFPSGNPAATLIVVTHSLGLHWLNSALSQRAAGLVICGGFSHFHLPDQDKQRFSKKHIARMQRLLRKDPQTLLENFYKDCDCDWFKPDMARLNVSLLERDLQMLDTVELNAAEFQSIPNILILHGLDDWIVPCEQGKNLQKGLPQSRFVEVKNAGHGLPFTHSETCLAEVDQMIRQVQKAQ